MAGEQPVGDDPSNPEEPLKFRVASHIVEDLGLNLYTSLPRVLVEFVANAYDADSPTASVEIDFDAIRKARDVVKAQWKLAKAEAAKKNDGGETAELERQTLPHDVKIVVTDSGHGMSRTDLQEKFLVAGRRRREEGASISPKGRVVMGRKGLGKLAGFGVAHRVVVTSKLAGESHATRITLDYDDLLLAKHTEEHDIPTEKIEGDDGLGVSGTRVVMSGLVYEPMNSDLAKIGNKIADHFTLIKEDDFSILLAGTHVVPTPRKWAYAFPEPDRAKSDMVEKAMDAPGDEGGAKLSFRYRIRFTGKKASLPARERGVRIYAHKRLASAPDLLDVDTNMHGFRLTDYLDGEVHADFIDDQKSEYIATDRQSLRWEAPLLAPMRAFLSEQMKEACKAYQKVRDEEAKKEAKEDPFTQEVIKGAQLPKHREKFAFQMAAKLGAVLHGGAEGAEYKSDLQLLVGSLAQGTLLKELGGLAAQKKPELAKLLVEASELTNVEMGEFVRFAHARLDGIAALKKIVQDVDFKAAHKEDELHRLFEKCPWLIDPTFSLVLTSDKTMETTFERLGKELQIGAHTPKGFDPTAAEESQPGKKNTRPDLVFLLGSSALGRVVIVELKAPNTPLHLEHLNQLERYIYKTEKYLGSHGHPDMRVEGYLIGSRDKITGHAEPVEALEDRIKKDENKSAWKVLDLTEVLERTRKAHKELVDVYERALEAAEATD